MQLIILNLNFTYANRVNVINNENYNRKASVYPAEVAGEWPGKHTPAHRRNESQWCNRSKGPEIAGRKEPPFSYPRRGLHDEPLCDRPAHQLEGFHHVDG